LDVKTLISSLFYLPAAGFIIVYLVKFYYTLLFSSAGFKLGFKKPDKALNISYVFIKIIMSKKILAHQIRYEFNRLISALKNRWYLFLTSVLADMLFVVFISAAFLGFVLRIRPAILNIMPLLKDQNFMQALALNQSVSMSSTQLIVDNLNFIKLQIFYLFISFFIIWLILKGISWFASFRLTDTSLFIGYFAKKFSLITAVYAIILWFFMWLMVVLAKTSLVLPVERGFLMWYPVFLLILISYFYYASVAQLSLLAYPRKVHLVVHTIMLFVLFLMLLILRVLILHLLAYKLLLLVIIFFIFIPLVALMKIIYLSVTHV